MSETGYPWPIETAAARQRPARRRQRGPHRARSWPSTSGTTSARGTNPTGRPASRTCSSTSCSRARRTSAKTEHMRAGAGQRRLAERAPPTRTAPTTSRRCRPSTWSSALWLEADRMGGLVPALTQETLDNQREVVKNERRQRYENVPYGDAWLRLLPLLYPPGHPYHHATIGSMEDLNAAGARHVPGVPPQLLRAEQRGADRGRRHRRTDEVVALAEKYFGGLPPVADIPPAPDGHAAARRPVPVRDRHRRGAGAAGLPRRTAPTRSAPREYDAVTVLATVLGSGRGSRLYQRLADGARLAQPDYVGAYGVDLAHAPAPLIVTATARTGVDRRAAGGRGCVEVVDELATGAGHRGRARARQGAADHRLVAAVSTVDGRADTLSRYATQFGDPGTAATGCPAGWRSPPTTSRGRRGGAAPGVPRHPDLRARGGRADPRRHARDRARPGRTGSRPSCGHRRRRRGRRRGPAGPEPGRRRAAARRRRAAASRWAAKGSPASWPRRWRRARGSGTAAAYALALEALGAELSTVGRLGRVPDHACRCRWTGCPRRCRCWPRRSAGRVSTRPTSSGSATTR